MNHAVIFPVEADGTAVDSFWKLNGDDLCGFPRQVARKFLTMGKFYGQSAPILPGHHSRDVQGGSQFEFDPVYRRPGYLHDHLIRSFQPVRLGREFDGETMLRDGYWLARSERRCLVDYGRRCQVAVMDR